MARELVRRIQDLRKTADLDVADRIRLYMQASSGLKQAVEKHQDYVMTETLTTDLLFEAPPAEASMLEDSFDGETLKAGLVKAEA
jgi:isoleucyl-tRNA synthetase